MDQTAKHDAGKLRPTLVPPKIIWAITKVREFGCKKYSDPDNWKKIEPQRCLCGHNVHQWVSGPEGWAVYCKHCGLESPWVRGGNAKVIEAWNAMILGKRMEQENG